MAAIVAVLKHNVIILTLFSQAHNPWPGSWKSKEIWKLQALFFFFCIIYLLAKLDLTWTGLEAKPSLSQWEVIYGLYWSHLVLLSRHFTAEILMWVIRSDSSDPWVGSGIYCTPSRRRMRPEFENTPNSKVLDVDCETGVSVTHRFSPLCASGKTLLLENRFLSSCLLTHTGT